MPRFTGRAIRSSRFGAALATLVLLALIGLARYGTAEDQPPAPAKAEYAGAETCEACHADVAEILQQNWHGALIANRPEGKKCEECHGPSLAHTEDPATVRTAFDVTHAPAAQSARACLTCHEATHRRSMGWQTSEHARQDVRCWDCHSQGSHAHAKIDRAPAREVCFSCHRDQQPTFELTSHHPVREGRIGCADCHEVHSRSTTRQTTQLCVSCHTKQRGPFQWSHATMTSGLSEGCLDCHRAHGSPNRKLQKYGGRGLCLQCHSDHALHFIAHTCWTSGCHKQIHGSNTNPLLLSP